MHFTAAVVFWGAVALLAYTYAGFGLLIGLWGSLRRRGVAQQPITPPVSMVVAAYNEAGVIERKIRNSLELDYPRAALELLVASDGSDDPTESIVLRFQGEGVHLLALPRRGKIHALDAAVARARGEILVFSDANTLLDPQALRALVRNFADPGVGGVCGNQIYVTGRRGDSSGDGESLYWSYDKWLKSMESRTGSIVSADGALYAIRHALYRRPESAAVTDDFAISTAVIEQGSRLVYEPRALAWEHTTGAAGREFARRVRLMTRGLNGVLLRRCLLNPWRYGFYALVLFSHKVVRRSAPLALLALLASSLMLAPQSRFYAAAAALQLGFYTLAAGGWLLRSRRVGRVKILTVPFFYCLANLAALVAWSKLLRGERIERWQPQRPAQPLAGGTSADASSRLESAAANPGAPSRAARDSVRKQLRGSSLLLAGRILAMGINFVAQLLVVRHLSTSEFGAFAYALAAVAFWRGFSTLGLRRGISRFIPIYQEKQDYGRIYGTLALCLGTAAVMSTLAIVGVHSWPELVARFVKDKGAPIDLMLILIFLVPLDALDELLVALFACFSHPKAIFYRKHVLGPGLKLSVVLLLLTMPDANVRFLAWGYLAASAASVAIYIAIFVRLLQREGLVQRLRQSAPRIPFVEIFTFTIPLLTSNLVAVVMHSADTMILGYFHPSTEVARYRAILPAADMNTLVLATFGILYTPLSARLFARQDHAGIQALYWRTAVWMAVFSFPIFALTFSLAPSVTVGLYGQRYANAAILLQMLSVGYYFDAALGNNGLTLKVLGKLRYVVVLNTAAMLTDVVLDLLFIPHYGAVGAAGTTMVSMMLHNIFKQIGLCRATGMRFIAREYLPVYGSIVAATAALLLLQPLLPGGLVVDVLLVGVAALLVIRVARRRLEVEATFPEILKLPFVGWLLRSPQPEPAAGRP